MSDSIIGTLIYRITGDTTALNTNLDLSKDKINKTGDSLVKLGQRAKTVATAVFSTMFVKSLLEASSRVEELGNKFDTVFSGMEKQADSWARTYSDATSRGVTSTKEFLATQQDLRTGYGDSTEKAAKFSQAVVGVTNDLASFSNVPVAEAMQAVNSGLSQQFEALRRLGVGLNVQIINQGAYAKAIGKTWEEMGNLERQEAILSGIVSQSKNALHQEIQLWQEYDYTIGDAAITADSFANSSQGLQQSFEDMKAELGDALLPVVTDLIGIALNGVKAFNSWDDSIQSLTVAALAFGAAMVGIGGPIGAVIGGLGALAVVISNHKSGTEELTAATDTLKETSSEYNTVIQTLNGNTEGLTKSELALLESRKSILRLEMTKSMNELAKSYDKVSGKIEEQNVTVSEAEQRLKAYEIAQKAINGDQRQMGLNLTVKANLELAGKLDSDPNRLFYEELEMLNQNIQESLVDGTSYVEDFKTTLSQAIVEANEDLIKANGDLADSELPIQEAILVVAQAYSQGLVDLKAYESAYPELAEKIKEVAATLKTESGELSDSNDVVEEAIAIGKAWQDQREAQRAELLEDDGKYKEAAVIKIGLLKAERDEEIRNLAIKAGIITKEEELTEKKLQDAYKDNEDFKSECTALYQYYFAEIDSINKKAEESTQKSVDEQKKAEDDLAKTREQNAREWTDKITQQGRTAMEKAAAEMEANGQIETAYGIRLGLIDSEEKAEIAALQKKIDAGEATEQDLTNLKQYYSLERVSLTKEESGAVAKAANDAADKAAEAEKKLADKREENSKTWMDKLSQQSKSAMECAASELEASGEIAAAYGIRLGLIDSEEKAEIAALQKKIDANEATEQDLTNLKQYYATERSHIEAEQTQAVLDQEEEAMEERKQMWKDFASEMLSLVKGFASAYVNLQNVMTDRQIAEIDRQTEAKLQALGIAEDSEAEKLQKEYDEAVKAGDMELAKEKADAIARLQIEEEAEEKKKELQAEQAERDRKLRVFTTILDTAAAVVRYLADPGGLPGVALSAMAGATGALQIAAIKAEGLPSFDVGANYVPKDMLAMVHQGETILPAPMAESVRKGDAVLGEGGQANVQVTVINNTASEVSTEEMGTDDQREIRITIGKVVEQQIGSGRYDNSLGQRFGIRRVGKHA